MVCLSFQRLASLKVLSSEGCNINTATNNKNNPLLSPSYIPDLSSTSWGSISPTSQLSKLRHGPGLRNSSTITEPLVPAGQDPGSEGRGKLPPLEGKDNNGRFSSISVPGLPSPQQGSPLINAAPQGGAGGCLCPKHWVSSVLTAAQLKILYRALHRQKKGSSQENCGWQGCWQ